jgi:hypothetical protein
MRPGQMNIHFAKWIVTSDVGFLTHAAFVGWCMGGQ